MVDIIVIYEYQQLTYRNKWLTNWPKICKFSKTASDIQKAWSIETNTILLKLEADFYLLWKTEINCFHFFISYILYNYWDQLPN